jgi:phosphoribosylformimino-5-aminoimidazole carboxamide ribotide isomerase
MAAEQQRLQVIPAVDVLGDEAVRLEQGDFENVALRELDPVVLVSRLVHAGARLIHVVDLDGARSGRTRPELIRSLVSAARPSSVQVSGGVRSVADAEELLASGAGRVVVGTAAFTRPDALRPFVDALGDRLVVAVDVREGRVAVEGWERLTSLTADEAIERCSGAGVPRLLCTAIERDGLLEGPDLELLRRVRTISRVPVLAAGGIRSLADLAAVEAEGCEGAIVGRALLSGLVPLSALA